MLLCQGKWEQPGPGNQLGSSREFHGRGQRLRTKRAEVIPGVPNERNGLHSLWEGKKKFKAETGQERDQVFALREQAGWKLGAKYLGGERLPLQHSQESVRALTFSSLFHW